MAVKPETNFIARVHRTLSPQIYREKMHNPYRGGTPDVWYSGDKSDLWVEYKYIGKKIGKSFKADLSPLQLKWLRDRYEQGRTVAVIVGYQHGGWIFTTPDEWEKSHELVGMDETFSSNLEITNWIHNVCSKVPR